MALTRNICLISFHLYKYIYQLSFMPPNIMEKLMSCSHQLIKTTPSCFILYQARIKNKNGCTKKKNTHRCTMFAANKLQLQRKTHLLRWDLYILEIISLDKHVLVQNESPKYFFSKKNCQKNIYNTITALSGSYKNVQLKNDVGMDIVALTGFQPLLHFININYTLLVQYIVKGNN